MFDAINSLLDSAFDLPKMPNCAVIGNRTQSAGHGQSLPLSGRSAESDKMSGVILGVIVLFFLMILNGIMRR